MTSRARAEPDRNLLEESVSIGVPSIKSMGKCILVNVFSVWELIMLKCSEWLKDRIIFYKPYTCYKHGFRQLGNHSMLLFACTVASTLLRLTTVKWGNVRAQVQAAYKSQFGCKHLYIIPHCGLIIREWSMVKFRLLSHLYKCIFISALEKKLCMLMLYFQAPCSLLKWNTSTACFFQALCSLWVEFYFWIWYCHKLRKQPLSGAEL